VPKRPSRSPLPRGRQKMETRWRSGSMPGGSGKMLDVSIHQYPNQFFGFALKDGPFSRSICNSIANPWWDIGTMIEPRGLKLTNINHAECPPSTQFQYEIRQFRAWVNSVAPRNLRTSPVPNTALQCRWFAYAEFFGVEWKRGTAMQMIRRSRSFFVDL
jgi:hypothetical protein